MENEPQPHQKGLAKVYFIDEHRDPQEVADHIENLSWEELHLYYDQLGARADAAIEAATALRALQAVVLRRTARLEIEGDIFGKSGGEQ